MHTTELSPDQRRIVECPHEGGHLLVLAGPGSGKTRAISERVGYLLRHAIAEPEQILALSFTRRAGDELADRITRLGHIGVTAGTFHHLCAMLLDQHGAAIGVRRPLRIHDDLQQNAVLARALASVNGWQADDRLRRRLREAISRRKRAGVDRWDDWRDGPFPGPLMRQIDDAYCGLLAAEGALDFDDLITGVIRLLHEDDGAAGIVRARYRYVFIDEFHDVSPEQHELLRLLAPPRMPDRQVMVVADPHQAIFAFRGAEAGHILSHYQRDYSPRLHRLTTNYRSTETIARAAGLVAPKAGATGVVHPGGQEITCVRCADQDEEAARLADLIERARASGNYAYDDIAVLYRTHSRADIAERVLLHREIPVRRVRPDRFFDQPEVREGLRYLDLIAAIHDSSFEPALNWPRVLVDELTMIQLRRLARASDLSLSRLAARPDLLDGQVSPLTRVAIEAFQQTVAAEMAPLADRGIDEISERLLTLLTRRRDPIPRAKRADLADTLTYLGANLEPVAASLHDALAAGRPIALVYGSDLDAVAAAVILRWVCERYLAHPVVDPDHPGAFVITFGEDRPITADGFGLGPRATRTVTFSTAARAWRLGQMALMRYERLDQGRFVVLDLETGSNHPNTTELLEVAALRLSGGAEAEVDACYASLVRPRGPAAITRGAHEVHGITWADVRGAPPPDQIMPALLSFLGDDALVGHYADQFDFPVLRRVARDLGLPPPANPTLDTYALARRLLPDEPHGLHELAARFGASERQTHRAPADALLTARVLSGLLAELRRDKELGALTEALPLVAISLIAAGIPLAADTALLASMGARAIAFGQGLHLLDRLRAATGAGAIDQAVHQLSTLDHAAEDDARWDVLLLRWREMVADYCRTARDHSLPAFLRFAALADAADLQENGAGRVTMMSIHGAKGKEWPLVFLIGVEEGQFPFYMAQTPDEIEEERRVLYVGMTRAMRRLCFLWSASSNGYHKQSSRFLSELPPDLIRHRHF